MKKIINHVQKHSKKIATHLNNHKHKYLFGTFGTFAIVKTFLLLVGFFGTLTISNIFAAGGELNSGNIVTEYGCTIDATKCNLSNRGIISIADDTFVNHTNLIDLNLGENQLTEIDLSELTNLQNLNLQSNQITTLPENIINLSYLFDFNGLNIYDNYINYQKLSDKLLNFINEKHATYNGDWRITQTFTIPYIDDYLCDNGTCEINGYCALTKRDIDCNDYSSTSCPTNNGCSIEKLTEFCDGEIKCDNIGDEETCNTYDCIWDTNNSCNENINPDGTPSSPTCEIYSIDSCPTEFGCKTVEHTICTGKFDETTITEEQCGVGDFVGKWKIENDNSCPIDCESQDTLLVVEDYASFIPGAIEINNLTISGTLKTDSLLSSNFIYPGLQGWKIIYITQTGIFGNKFKFISTNDGIPYLSLIDNDNIYIKKYENGKRKTVSKGLANNINFNIENYSYDFGIMDGNIPYIFNKNSLNSLDLSNGEWITLVDNVEYIGNDLGGKYLFTNDSLRKLSNGELTELSLPNTSCEVMDVKGSTPGAEGIEIFAIYSCENGNKEFWSLTDDKKWIQIAKDKSHNGNISFDKNTISNIIGGGINTYIKPNIVEIYFYNEELGYEIYDYFYFVDNKRVSLPGRPNTVLDKNDTLYFVINDIFYAYDGKDIVLKNEYNTFSTIDEETEINYLSDKNGDFYIHTINNKNTYPNQRANLFKFSNGKWNKIMDFTPLYNQYDSGEDNRLAILPVPGIYGIQLDENGLPLIGCFVFALNEESSGPHNIKADIYQWSDSTDSHFIKWLDMIGENTDIDSIVDTITDFIGGKEETKPPRSDFENQTETLYKEKNYLSQQINEIELGNLSSYILNDFKNNKELELNELEKSDSFTEAELSQLKNELIIIIDKIAFLKGEPISDLLLSELIRELDTDRKNKEIEINRIQEYDDLTNEQIEELTQLEKDREMINSKINQLASRNIPQEIIDEITNEITNEIINEIINGLNNQINLIQGEIDTLNDEIQKLKDIVDDEQLDETELIEKVRSALNTILLSGNININIPLAPYVIHIDGNDGISTYNNYTQDEVVFDAKLNLDNGISADINSDLPFVISYQAGNIKIRKYTNKKWDVLIEETINAENDGIRSRFPVLFQNDAIIITHDKEKENISIKGYKNTNRSTLIDLGTELPSVDTLISMFEDSMEISNTIKDDNKEKKGWIIDYFPGFFTYNERLYGVINEFGLASFGNGIRHVSNTGLDLGDNILGSRMDSDGVEHIIKTTQTKTGTTLVTYSLEDTLKDIEFQYQWYSNDKTIDGANNINYTSNSFDAGNEIYLTVAVKNAIGLVGLPVKSNVLIIEKENTGPTKGSITGSIEKNTAGKSITLNKDNCPKGDFSPSYYDSTCEKSLTINNDRLPTHNSANLPVGDITNSPYSSELNNAYLRAHEYGITTMGTIQKANITGTLIRKDMAKMIINFAVNILKKDISTGVVCEFSDTASLTKEAQYYAMAACRLGLMGYESDGVTIKKNFDPEIEVDRGQFGTILSRLMRENKYDNGSPYYKKHLNALKTEGIMTKIENPSMQELRGRTMLMMMRMFEKE